MKVICKFSFSSIEQAFGVISIYVTETGGDEAAADIRRTRIDDCKLIRRKKEKTTTQNESLDGENRWRAKTSQVREKRKKDRTEQKTKRKQQILEKESKKRKRRETTNGFDATLQSNLKTKAVCFFYHSAFVEEEEETEQGRNSSSSEK